MSSFTRLACWKEKIFIVAAVQTARVAETPPHANEQAKTEPPANYHQFVCLAIEYTWNLLGTQR